MKARTTWVLVADGAHARVLENKGPGKGLHQVAGTDTSVSLPPSREIADDRPGRSFESSGPTRHALESRTDPHRELKRDFAGQLVEMLEQRRAGGAFDRLVVVAPPVTLGDLRKAMPKALAAMVVAEVDRDLTHEATDRILSHLGDVPGL